MDRAKISGVTLALAALVASGCGGGPKKIVVASKNFTEQVVLGEIVAQHLENRLQRKVERRLNLGGTLLTYQALLGGDVSVYPEYLGTIQAEILKEPPGTDSVTMLERARIEMRRLAQSEVLDPLGVNNTFVLVVRTADAKQRKVATLSEASKVSGFWKLGAGYEFSQRSDGMPLLAKYKFEWIAPPRSMDLGLLFKALAEGQVTMVAANATDGPLTSPDYTILSDDQKVFPPYDVCLMVRQDSLAAEPRMKGALAELSGKFSNETMRKLNAQVDVEHRQARDVAAQFLAQAGLK
jgi:osmoprotectant transport system substrate-binding protein